MIRTLTILILEADQDDARRLEEALKSSASFPVNFLHAVHVSAAVEAHAQTPFDALLLDVDHPENKRMQAVKKLSDLDPPPVLITLDRSAEAALGKQSVEAGAHDFWQRSSGVPILERSIVNAFERQQLREQLEQSESRYQEQSREIQRLREFNGSVIETIAGGLVREDERGNINLANTNILELLGYQEAEMLGEHWSRFVPPEERDKVARHSAQRKEGRSGAYESLLLSKERRAIPVMVSATPFTREGHFAGTLVTFTDISERAEMERALWRRDSRLEAVSYAATQFLASQDWQGNLHEVLMRLGEAAGVSRLYVFKNHQGSDGTLLTSQQYEWVAEGISPQIDNPDLQNVPWVNAGMGRWVEKLSRGEAISGPVRNFPESERAILEPQEILSLVVVPVFVGQSWWGFIGFDDCVRERDWSLIEVDALNAAASTFGAAIQHKRFQDDIQRRAEELAGLHEISSSIGRLSNLQETYGGLSESLALLIDAPMCVLALHDPFRDEIRGVSPGYGVPDDILLKIRYSSSRAGQIWDFPKLGAFLANSPAEIPETYAEIAKNFQLQSVIAAPMFSSKKLVGVVFAANKTGGFSQEDARLMSVFANQAGLLIEKAHLFDSSQRQLSELSVLHAVADASVHAVDEDDLLERATTVIGETIYPDHFGILLLDESIGALRIHPSYRGISAEDHKRIIQPGEGVSGQVFVSGIAQRVVDVSELSYYIPSSQEMRSELCVPLKVADHIIGVINVESRQGNAFQETDERLLTILAGQLATAINRLRGEKSDQEQRIFVEALNDTVALINSTLDFEEVLDRILENVGRVVPIDSGAIMLLENGYAHQVKSRGYEKHFEKDWDEDLRLEISQIPDLQEIIQTRKPIIIPDTHAHPEWKILPQTRWIRSYIGSPIIGEGGEVIGFLNINHTEPDFFKSHHAERLFTFSNQVSVAIRNARLFQTALKAAERRVVLHRVSREIAEASRDAEQVYEAIHRAAQELMSCDAFVITMVLKESQSLEAVYLVDGGVRYPAQTLSKGDSLSGNVISSGNTMRMDDLAPAGENTYFHFGEPDQVRSALAVPLRHGQEPIGMISAQSYEPHAYSRDDEAILEMLAAYAAAGLENARLFTALKENEDLYRTLFESVPMGIGLFELSGDALAANLAMQSILGLSETDINPVTASEYYQNLDDRRQILGQIESKGEVRDYELGMVRPDGTPYQARISIIPIHLSGEIAFLALMEDISERREAEETMRLQARTLEVAANSIVITDRDGIIEWVNPAFTAQTGFTAEDTYGKTPRILKSGEQDRSFYKDLWDTILAGEVWHGKLINRRKDGSLYIDEQTITPIQDASGEITHFIAIKNDVTEREKAETALKRQLDELSTLHAVAIASVEANDEDDLIEKATKIIGDTLFPDHFGVLLLDESKGILKGHPSYQGINEEDRLRSFRLGEGITGQVAQSGIPILISDASKDPNYIASAGGMRSEICVPLRLGDHTIGVLNAEDARPEAYSEHDERLLLTIAGYLATAIERLRSEEAEREQRVLAEALQDTAVALNSTLDFNKLLDRILANVGRVVPFQSASIALISNGFISIVRTRGFEERGLIDWISRKRISITETPNLRRVIETGNPVVVSDTQAYPDWIEYTETAWIRSNLVAPIKRNNHILGILLLDHGTPGFFTDLHADRLQTFANQVSIALENSRLFAETRRRLDELEAMSKITAALRLASSLDEMLTRLLDETLEIMGTDAGTIWLYDEASSELQVAISRGWFDPLNEQPMKPEEGIAGRVFISGESHFSRDFATDPLTLEQSRESIPPGWGGACIPILTGAQVVGVMFISVQLPRQLAPDEIHMLTTLAELAGNAIHRSRLDQLTQQQLRRLSALRQIDSAITGSLDLRVILNVLLDQVITQLEVHAADVMLLDNYTQTLEFVTGRGFRTNAVPQLQTRLGKPFAGEIALEKQSIQIPDISEYSSDVLPEIFTTSENFKAYFGMPLVSKGAVLGVLEVFHRKPIYPASDWLDFLNSLSGQAAIAIDNIKMLQDLHRSNDDLVMAYDSTLEGWARALELRDMETKGHSHRVTEMTQRLAILFGLKDEDLVNIRRGSMLHDIGKMGIPDSILHKPGPLTDLEWEIMRQHPVYSYNLLRKISFLRQALDIPYSHHEKWDGSGYPQGLKGKEIPLPARIFAVVDVWDALTSDRPYRKAWTEEETLAYIRDQSGRHFDPEIVESFLKLVAEGG